jgi:hypothetical protein
VKRTSCTEAVTVLESFIYVAFKKQICKHVNFEGIHQTRSTIYYTLGVCHIMFYQLRRLHSIECQDGRLGSIFMGCFGIVSHYLSEKKTEESHRNLS